MTDFSVTSTSSTLVTFLAGAFFLITPSVFFTTFLLVSLSSVLLVAFFDDFLVLESNLEKYVSAFFIILDLSLLKL